jgi:hypothetical protein
MDTDAWLTISIAFYVVVASAILLYAIVTRHAGLFEPIVQCVTFVSLYTLPLSIRARVSDVVEGDVTEHLPQLRPFLPAAVSYTALALIVFAFAYYSRIATSLGRSLPHTPLRAKPRPYVAFAIVGAIAVFLIALLTRAVGGFLPFMLLGYAASAETFGRGYLAVGFPWLFVASLFLLISYQRTRRRRDVVAFIVLLAIQIGLQLVLGDRSLVLYMVLTVGMFFHFAIRPLSPKALVASAVVSFVFLTGVGLVRSSMYGSIDDVVQRTTASATSLRSSGNALADWTYPLTVGEFAVPFETMAEMIRSTGTRIPAEFGLTYLKAPLFFIPSVLFPSRPAPLATWYVNTFYGGGFGKNEGREFFFLAEGYLNGGPGGVLLLAILWGVLWGGIAQYLRSADGNPGSVLLVALSIAFLFRAIAGDSVSLLVGLPEQNLSAALIGLAVMSGARKWQRVARANPDNGG